MKKLARLFTLMAVLILSLSMSYGCNNDDDDDDNDDNDTISVVCDDLLSKTECEAEDSCEWFDEDEGFCTDATSTTGDDDDDNDDDETGWEGAEEVNLVTPDGVTTTVALYGMSVSSWVDADDDDTEKIALSLQTFIDEALEGGSVTASDYRYNFIGSDGFDILARKLGGDVSGLPTYTDLARGRFIVYEEDDGLGNTWDDVRVRWDLGLNFPTYMAARMMSGGTIEMLLP
jgi:hypothetical protein